MLQRALAKAYLVKREWGENPLREFLFSVCTSKFLYSSVKAGHWETEKVEYKKCEIF